MGCDIHLRMQKLNSENKWEDVSPPERWRDEYDCELFSGRSYSLFGWLAGVRNYSAITPLSEPRGRPLDMSLDNDYDGLGDHSFSWFSTEELVSVDYNQIVEDRRCARRLSSGIISGGETCDTGEGEQMTLREFLGDFYVNRILELPSLGVDRIVFGFDS